jgi:hypothetical protein
MHRARTVQVWLYEILNTLWCSVDPTKFNRSSLDSTILGLNEFYWSYRVREKYFREENNIEATYTLLFVILYLSTYQIFGLFSSCLNRKPVSAISIRLKCEKCVSYSFTLLMRKKYSVGRGL